MTASVLIVDDSSSVRMELAEALGAAGFRAVTSADAAAAREVLAVEPISVLVLDVILPDIDGVTLLREIRSHDIHKNLPVLLLASENAVAEQLRELGCHADAYIGKPYEVDQVVHATRQLAARHTPSEPAPKSGSPGHTTVLVIDDSATFRLHLTMALTEAGYTVIEAITGEEGLRVAAAQRPHAMIIDGVLPGIDGATVVRRVRLDAALRKVPCILLTATEEPDAELRALDSGADAFVRKDQDLDLTLAKLTALLRVSRSRAESSVSSSPLTCTKILAVDSSANYRAQLATVLEGEGYDVALVRTGEEALERLAAQTVDCVLLDMGADGNESCRRIKSSPALRDVPVIMLMSIENRASILASLEIGADDCIPKAAGPEVLKARVQAQLRRRQFEEETRRTRDQLIRSEIQAAAASSARQLAETRATLVSELEKKNQELQTAYAELQATQGQLVQSAKMASLGELVAGVAHEINNPLAFVLSHLETVKRSLNKVHPDAAVLPDGSREPWQRALSRLQEMHLGLERIRELVLKLRTFSRLDEGEYKRVSIRECIDSLLTILAHKLKDRIEVRTDYGEPDQLDCYPGLLTQAIMNMVANSIDAISGPGTITITTGRAGEVFRISITDTGHGIPQHLRERVFEPFFTTKPVGEGTGLGLSIVYSIVRKHGGTLTLNEPPTGGTQVIIDLPFEAPQQQR